MRERDLKAFDFDKIVALVRQFAVSEPARRLIERLAPETDSAPQQS
jgi:hypothetical protein